MAVAGAEIMVRVGEKFRLRNTTKNHHELNVPVSALNFIYPVLHLTCPDLSCNNPVLHLSCPASVLSCI